MSTVKLGLTDLSATELVEYCQGVHDGIDGNLNYTTPLPATATVQTAIDTLTAANAAVSLNDGRLEHIARRAAQKALHALMKQWAGYVQLTSNGDEDKILSSGFDVVRRGKPSGEPDRPTALVVLTARKTGRIAMEWERPAGAKYFHVFRSLVGAPYAWELVGTTSKTRFNSDDNEPGTFYYYSVTAIGAGGESSMSDELRAMAAA